MKCPKCSLVTFDHLTRCPRCKGSFAHARRLTRKRDPNRRIVLAGVPPSPRAATTEPADGVRGTTEIEAPAAPRPEPTLAREAGADTRELVPERTTQKESRLPVGTAVDRSRTAAPEDRVAREPVAPAPSAARCDPAPVPGFATPEQHEADATHLKERMMLASRARRRRDAEMSTEPVDPVLPDWYEPTLNDDQAVARRRVAGKSRN